MGNRIPGVVGHNPPPPEVTSSGIGAPVVGILAPGPIGTSAGTGGGTTPPAALVLAGWPRTLTWADFSEVESRPSGSDENAQIHSEITQPENVAVQHEHGQYRVSSLTVNLSVDPGDSWVVRAQKTPELLSHEQGHYDLTGLMGRDMGNEIMAARGRTVHALQLQVTGIITRYRRRAADLNSRYDTETDHGRTRDAQQRWDEHIRGSIRNGTRFSAP
jgi:Bacterial protein of unknown function (DUF922)